MLKLFSSSVSNTILNRVTAAEWWQVTSSADFPMLKSQNKSCIGNTERKKEKKKNEKKKKKRREKGKE